MKRLHLPFASPEGEGFCPRKWTMMRKEVLFAGVILVSLLGSVGAAEARCASAERQQMRDAGMSEGRIADLCGSYAGHSTKRPSTEDSDDDWDQSDSELDSPPMPRRSPMPTGGAAQGCFTRAGACPMRMP